MDFFRMRVLNTFLVLLIGAMLGYLIRGGSHRGAAYRLSEKPPAAAPVIAASEPDENGFSAFRDRPAGEPEAPAAAGENQEKDDFELPVRLPAGRIKEDLSGPEEDAAPADETEDADTAENGKPDKVTRGSDDDFFNDPKRFAGEDIEMELQMLTAAKKPKGWLINLTRIKGGKNADYVYIEDDSVLGDKPDLKIGYFYKTRFRCRKGDVTSGNTLLYLAPTGGKASWATGISAIE